MKYVTVLLALMMIAPAVAGLGLSPAKVTMVESGEFVVNILDAEGELGVRLEGPYKEYFSITEVTPTYVRGTLTIPDANDPSIPPGDHTHRLVVSESRGNEGVLSAAVELVSLIVMRKQYDGPYLEANVHSSVDEGKQNAASLYVTLTNIGNEDVLPNSIMVRVLEDEYVMTPRMVPTISSETFSVLVTGVGEYDADLLVEGDAPVMLTFPITLGLPEIDTFTVTLVEEGGVIIPLDVEVGVSWNVPVAAQIHVGEDTYERVIDGSFSERFYVETTAEEIEVTLQLGTVSQTVKIDVRHEEMVVEKEQPWVWLVVLIVLAVILLYVLFRKRQK